MMPKSNRFMLYGRPSYAQAYQKNHSASRPGSAPAPHAIDFGDIRRRHDTGNGGINFGAGNPGKAQAG